MPTWYLAGTERYRGPVPATAGYQGPGDVVSGAMAWWGLRAYNALAASGGMAAVRLVDSALANATDIHLLSNGLLDFSPIPFGSGAPYSVETLYDQSGNNRHLTGSTRRPGFVSTGNGLTVPNMSFVRASGQYLNINSATFSASVPLTVNAVFNRTFTVGQFNGLVDTGSLNFNLLNAASTVYMYAGGSVISDATVTDGSWHTAQAVFTNSASDTLVADNHTAVTGSAGTVTIASQDVYMGSTVTADYFDGLMAEAGIWPVAFTAPQLTAMYANQHTYYAVF